MANRGSNLGLELRHGGQILIDQLEIQGCEQVFCVPGESYLAALDGLASHARIRTVVCRQEGGAAMMAEAHAKMTGRPGVCFVTRAPGASNAAAGLHIAHQDSTPMILFIGQVARDSVDREAFQEVDYRQMFGPLAKWVAQVDSTERIPEYVSHAYHTATAGRPGPVVLALPEDMLSAQIRVQDAGPAFPVQAAPSEPALARITEMLRTAERPVLLVGGPGWSPSVQREVQTFAQRLGLPVVASFRCQDYYDNQDPSYIGDLGIGVNPKLVRTVRESDLLLVMGARLGELTTQGYTLIDIPEPSQPLVHVHASAEELGRVYRPTLAINASNEAFAERLADIDPPPLAVWRAWTGAARADYEAWTTPHETPGAVKLEQVVRHVSDTLPADAIITNGAGNYTAFVQRYYRYRGYRTQLAPTSGSMGYGLPAAVAAKLVAPERTVVCFAGDGCFQMTGQELATAVQYELALIIIVVNNAMYGTIRMHQERHYPGRTIATDLRNPDFAALARAHGAHGETVERGEDFAASFARALQSDGPALIELRTDPEAISPTQTLSGLQN